MGRVEEHAHVGTVIVLVACTHTYTLFGLLDVHFTYEIVATTYRHHLPLQIDVVAGVGGALATAAALLHLLRRRADSLVCPIVARASLASLGMIVQFPFCCGTLSGMRAEAAASSCRLGPECLGEHALLRCYQASDGAWLMLCGALLPVGASPTADASLLVALAKVDHSISEAVKRAAAGEYDDAALAAALSAVFSNGHSAAGWVRGLQSAGIRGATLLHSLSELRATHDATDARLACGVAGGPTFQFLTDATHPLGGPVTMFAPCAVRVVDKSLPLPLRAAPRYGEHTREVLRELGIDASPLLARGLAATGWTAGHEYLPDYSDQRAAPPPPLQCPVCLEAALRPVLLACSHMLCSDCAARCDMAGHASCPVCRHPHLLDPKLLGARSADWRRRYSAWRAGGGVGSSGEYSAIIKPRHDGHSLATRLRHSSLAGDLALADESLVGAPTFRAVRLAAALPDVGKLGRACSTTHLSQAPPTNKPKGDGGAATRSAHAAEPHRVRMQMRAAAAGRVGWWVGWLRWLAAWIAWWGGVVTLRDVCVGCARWARSTGYPHGRRRAKEGAGHTQMHT